MKKAAVIARRKPASGPGGGFLIVHQHELDVLDTLALWEQRLFEALVRLSDYTTGYGQTTLAMLVLRLTPIQPRNGGPRLFVPGVRQIRAALAGFEERLLMKRDTVRSAAGKCLFFHVDPRGLETRLNIVSAGGYRRPNVARKSSNGAASRPVIHKLAPGVSAALLQEA